VVRAGPQEEFKAHRGAGALRPLSALPDGSLFRKTTARAGKQRQLDPQTARTLSDVSVRRLGDTAILNGILTTKSSRENSKGATTVVFVQSSGKWKIASAQWTPVAPAK